MASSADNVIVGIAAHSDSHPQITTSDDRDGTITDAILDEAPPGENGVPAEIIGDTGTEANEEAVRHYVVYTKDTMENTFLLSDGGAVEGDEAAVMPSSKAIATPAAIASANAFIQDIISREKQLSLPSAVASIMGEAIASAISTINAFKHDISAAPAIVSESRDSTTIGATATSTKASHADHSESAQPEANNDVTDRPKTFMTAYGASAKKVLDLAGWHYNGKPHSYLFPFNADIVSAVALACSGVPDRLFDELSRVAVIAQDEREHALQLIIQAEHQNVKVEQLQRQVQELQTQLAAARQEVTTLKKREVIASPQVKMAEPTPSSVKPVPLKAVTAGPSRTIKRPAKPAVTSPHVDISLAPAAPLSASATAKVDKIIMSRSPQAPLSTRAASPRPSPSAIALDEDGRFSAEKAAEKARQRVRQHAKSSRAPEKTITRKLFANRGKSAAQPSAPCEGSSAESMTFPMDRSPAALAHDEGASPHDTSSEFSGDMFFDDTDGAGMAMNHISPQRAVRILNTSMNT